jgi:hypothetical protein
MDLSRANIVVSKLKHIIEFKGRKNCLVKDVTLSGLRFAHTESTFLEPYDIPSMGDWTIYRGGAVVMESTAHCQIENCIFSDLSGNALF